MGRDIQEIKRKQDEDSIKKLAEERRKDKVNNNFHPV